MPRTGHSACHRRTRTAGLLHPPASAARVVRPAGIGKRWSLAPRTRERKMRDRFSGRR
jgi:hypothetical protein